MQFHLKKLREAKGTARRILEMKANHQGAKDLIDLIEKAPAQGWCGIRQGGRIAMDGEKEKEVSEDASDLEVEQLLEGFLKALLEEQKGWFCFERKNAMPGHPTGPFRGLNSESHGSSGRETTLP